MQIPPLALKLLGSGSLLCAAGALLGIPFGLVPAHRPLDSYLFVIALLGVISGGVLVAARLQQRRDTLAVKAVPSTLAAYLLFILMALRWLAPS